MIKYVVIIDYISLAKILKNKHLAAQLVKVIAEKDAVIAEEKKKTAAAEVCSHF